MNVCILNQMPTRLQWLPGYRAYRSAARDLDLLMITVGLTVHPAARMQIYTNEPLVSV